MLKIDDPLPREQMVQKADNERGVLDILKDVAARHGAEGDDDIEIVLDAIGEPVYALGPEGHIAYYNRAAAKQFGLEGDEGLGMPAGEVVTDETEEAATDAIIRSLKDPEHGGESIEVRVTTDDGSSRVFEHTLTPYLTEDGEFRGVVAVAKDVTEVIQVRGELEDDRQALRDLYEVAGRSDFDLGLKVRRLLEIGCERLDLPYGFVTDIRDETQYIWQAVGDHPDLQSGASSPLAQSYCRKTIARDDLVAYQNAPTEGMEGDPAYQRFGLACYVGGKLTVDGELHGTLCFADEHPREHRFNDGERTFVKLLAQWVGREFERERHLRTMELRARTDPLTGLVNHGEIFNRLEQEIQRAARYSHTVSVAMLDLDHFKDLNDRHGHLVGDEVLRTFGELLRDQIRDADIAGRYGGEEFVTIVPHVGVEGTAELAERFCEHLRGHPFETDAGDMNITCSIGVAELDSYRETAEELIDRADTALYEAKQKGRDRVETSD